MLLLQIFALNETDLNTPSKLGKPEGFDSCDKPSNLTQTGLKSSIFQPMWPWNSMDNLVKAIGHLFYTMSSFVHPFKSMGEFKLELQSGNTKFRSKSSIFCPVWSWNLTDRWTSKTIRHIFYTALSFVRNSKAMDEFKLKLQSRNSQFGSKSAKYSCPVYPWDLTDYLEKQ